MNLFGKLIDMTKLTSIIIQKCFIPKSTSYSFKTENK